MTEFSFQQLKTVTEHYPRSYALLKRYGHGATKAAEIVREAKRGDRIALDWLRQVHRAYLAERERCLAIEHELYGKR